MKLRALSVLVVLLPAACAVSSPEASQTSDLGAKRPAACRVVKAGTFANGTQLTPALYGQQPTFRAPLATAVGDAALADQLRVRLDAATGSGSHALTGAATCYEKGAQCVTAHVDLDPASGAAAKTFAAVRGTVELGDAITPDERAGTIRGVELREITIAQTNVPWRAAELVPGGECLWVDEATFDTRRADGCDPTAKDACGSGRSCIAENAAGSDGSCVTAGTKSTGASCALDDAGGSDCAEGHRCVDLGGGTTCIRTCDVMATATGCAAAESCQAFGLCRPIEASDPALVGESCTNAEGACGRDGARGLCFELWSPDNQPWDKGSKCWGFARARSACAPGDDLGYQSFARGNDRSLGICTLKL